MPSPIGHGLAGLAIGLVLEPPRPAGAQTTTRRLSNFALVGAALAALPDADLVYSPIHRGVSHSIGLTVLLMIIAAVVTGWVTGRVQWRWVVLIGAAHASHILMDWLGTDRYPPTGLEALWPFNRQFYISGWDVFPPTERRIYLPGAVLINVRAFFTEAAIMGPVAALAYLVRRTRRNRVPTSVRDNLPRPSA
jgi:membrane-bound metal-dependent hydrolase YbcI (DUF457 family)